MVIGAVQVVASVVLGILILKLFSSKYKNLPPGPRGLPVIGTMHRLGPYPHRDFAKLSATYGPVMTMWMGQKLAVVVSSAAMAKEILNTQDSNFSSRRRTSFGELLMGNGNGKALLPISPLSTPHVNLKWLSLSMHSYIPELITKPSQHRST